MTGTRVGLIVPSSNVTMEIELPQVMGGDPPLSFHSSRMVMRTVSAEELRAMDAVADRCADELMDARCDVLAYACLVAVMVQGRGAHRDVESRLSAVCRARDHDVPVVSSAGALVETLTRAGVSRVAVVAPYVPSLTETVVDYIEGEGITPISVRSLGVADNYEVGRIPAATLRSAVGELDLGGAEALVLSACVQMPSLALVESVQAEVGIPVVTAATATAAAVLNRLGREPSSVPGCAGKAWSLQNA